MLQEAVEINLLASAERMFFTGLSQISALLVTCGFNLYQAFNVSGCQSGMCLKLIAMSLLGLQFEFGLRLTPILICSDLYPHILGESPLGLIQIFDEQNPFGFFS